MKDPTSTGRGCPAGDTARRPEAARALPRARRPDVGCSDDRRGAHRTRGRRGRDASPRVEALAARRVRRVLLSVAPDRGGTRAAAAGRSSRAAGARLDATNRRYCSSRWCFRARSRAGCRRWTRRGFSMLARRAFRRRLHWREGWRTCAILVRPLDGAEAIESAESGVNGSRDLSGRPTSSEDQVSSVTSGQVIELSARRAVADQRSSRTGRPRRRQRSPAGARRPGSCSRETEPLWRGHRRGRRACPLRRSTRRRAARSCTSGQVAVARWAHCSYVASLSAEPGSGANRSRGDRGWQEPARGTSLVERATTPVWSPTGHMLFRAGGLRARDGLRRRRRARARGPSAIPVIPRASLGTSASGSLGLRRQRTARCSTCPRTSRARGSASFRWPRDGRLRAGARTCRVRATTTRGSLGRRAAGHGRHGWQRPRGVEPRARDADSRRPALKLTGRTSASGTRTAAASCTAGTQLAVRRERPGVQRASEGERCRRRRSGYRGTAGPCSPRTADRSRPGPAKTAEGRASRCRLSGVSRGRRAADAAARSDDGAAFRCSRPTVVG